MLDYNFIQEKAKKERIDEITIAREYYQLLFLQRLYLEKGSNQFHFKGGTAIRFLLYSFRFSEDLDFTFNGKKTIAEEILQKVFRFFIKNSNDNVEIKKIKEKGTLKNQALAYRFLFLPKGRSQKVSIRVEVSLREKPLTAKTTLITPFDYPISPYPLVVHLDFKEILAEKIRAFFVRGKPRDLFDLWFLLTKKIPIDEKIIKKKFELYGSLEFSIDQLKKKVKNYDQKELKKDLNQFLPENYRNFYQILAEEVMKFILLK